MMTTGLNFIFFELLYLSLLTLNVYSEEIEVISSFGRLKGLTTHRNGHNLYEFRKIPYAVPPIGNLRFQKPKPHRTLPGLYDATKFGPSCMQVISRRHKLVLPNADVSEDCLHLNIYIPYDISSLPRAVMIWIHGGSFVSGQGMGYDGSLLALTGNVIVITINYRLGVFGFLSTEDNHYPGNYGLFDQLEAIKWTKQHIASVGGDPKRITIFGESAGAFCVAYLASSPLSKSLFQRVIMESGGDMRSMAVDRGMRNTTIEVMKQLGCLSDTSITNVSRQCMEHVAPTKILQASSAILTSRKEPVTVYKGSIGPSIDGDLVQGVPESLLQNLTSKSTYVFDALGILMGINDADGSLILNSLRALQSSSFNVNKGISATMFCNEIVSSIVRQYFHSNEKVREILCNAYSNTSSIEEQGRSVVQFAGDFVFGAPMKQILDIHSNHSTKGTYQYLFTKGSFQRRTSHLLWLYGAKHADELPFLFRLNHIEQNYTDAEEDLSDIMMTYWSNFAKTGNPNRGGRSVPYWPSYQSGKAYLELNDVISTHHDLYKSRLAIWLKTIPNILADEGLPSLAFG